MYNNNQASPYIPSGYPNTYPQYSQGYSDNYGYQGYVGFSNQAGQQVSSSVSTQDNFTPNNWTSYNSNQNDGVAQEMQQQKAQLIKQREDYVKKSSVLKRELDQLQVQKQDLVGNGRSPDKDLSNILQQNAKLQEEIQGKIKAIHNVIEMLSGIIKDGKSIGELEAILEQPTLETLQSSTANKTADNSHRSHTPEPPTKNSAGQFCYVHYDTGLHWCRMCDYFPATAKDFLLHLQDKKHREMIKENGVDSTPWHKLPTEPPMSSDENAPLKRIPIKGLQFFIFAPSWFCKLCDVWIGDLHCASQHLKSQTHHQNYENFVGQNPHWEMEWIKDREKAMTRRRMANSSESDEGKKRQKRKTRHSNEVFTMKEKKKKKRSKKKKKQSSDSSSSSSSSDSSSDNENEDKSKSIRVAMRNMQKVQSIMDEDLSAKWNVLERLVEEHKKKEKLKERQDKEKKEIPPSVDPLINQWMTVSQPPDKEKLMLTSLKDRMRQKQEQERTRMTELEKIKREKQREEFERFERKKREERGKEEEMERLKKEKDQEDLYRFRDKDRNQVRFKASSYRKKRRSNSKSDDDNNTERFYKYDKKSTEKEGDKDDSYKDHNSRSRSRSYDQERILDREHEENDVKKKPTGPPNYKKLPFIGRMPLFKNKLRHPPEQKEEIKKRDYETPRKTRFEPGNLPKAFIPKPDVVCFPKLSSIPPLTVPPPPPIIMERVIIPEAPKISKSVEQDVPKAPPPPIIDKKERLQKTANLSDDEVLYGSEGVDASMMGQYYQEFNSSSYQNQCNQPPLPPSPLSHSLPLQPPPLPPDDDLALLGICADDMAAQSF